MITKTTIELRFELDGEFDQTEIDNAELSILKLIKDAGYKVCAHSAAAVEYKRITKRK